MPILFFAGMVASTLALAETCHTELPEEVTWIVPNTPGSTYDIYGRLLTTHLAQDLKISFRIDNRSGGGGLAGARRIINSNPDATTVGIVNGAMLMAGQLLSESDRRPNLASFAIIGRINRVKHVWVVKKGSPLADLNYLIEYARRRPVVVATRDISSSSFFSLTIGASLLHMPVEVVAGYASNRDARLAILRDEVDMSSVNFQTGLNMIESDELDVVVQIADHPIDTHPSLSDVPNLAELTQVARDDAIALTRFLGAGMLVVGPQHMAAQKLDCMRAALARVVATDAFTNDLRQLRRSIDFAAHDEVLEEWESILAQIQSFHDDVLPHLQKIQGTPP